MKDHHRDDHAHIKSKMTKVQFNNPAMIESKEEDNSIHGFKNPNLRREVTAKAIKDFICMNEQFLTTSSSGDIVFKDPSKKEDAKEENKLNYFKKLIDQLGDTFDADIIEFDDHFAKDELVYSIIVNRYVLWTSVFTMNSF